VKSWRGYPSKPGLNSSHTMIRLTASKLEDTTSAEQAACPESVALGITNAVPPSSYTKENAPPVRPKPAMATADRPSPKDMHVDHELEAFSKDPDAISTRSDQPCLALNEPTDGSSAHITRSYSTSRHYMLHIAPLDITTRSPNRNSP
jgi:hypothetical protein